MSEEMLDQNETNTEEEVKEFDFNDPALLEEEADVVDPDKDADEVPPPPPDAIYTMNFDFAETDEEKRFSIRKWAKGFFLMTNLIGTIVDCKDEKIPEREWINRKVRCNIMSIVNQDGGCTLTDWLKSVGRKDEVTRIAKEVAAGRMNKKEQFEAYSKAVTDAIVAGAQGQAATQWTGSYKRVSPETNEEEYLRPGGKLSTKEKIAKDHPIQKFRGMKSFPFKEALRDGETVKVRNPVAVITDPDTDEDVEVRASAEVRTFIPVR